MATATVKKQKSSNTFDVSFKGLTLAEMYAMRNALASWALGGSPVGEDVLTYFQNGSSECVEVNQYFKDNPF